MSAAELIEDQDTEAKIINEGCFTRIQPAPSTYLRLLEYKTWKKNSPFLYDMILRYSSAARKVRQSANDRKHCFGVAYFDNPVVSGC